MLWTNAYTKGITVKTKLRMGLVLSVVAIVAVMMLGQASAQPTLKQQVLTGGTFQVVDIATAPCSGQCAIANWQTGICQCAPNYVPVETARMLINELDAAQNTHQCGATLFTCVIPSAPQ
jgi:hypothetical protein